MTKNIDLSKTIYELSKEYPELIKIMAGLGFNEITKKAMLNSVGKFTTIPKGAKMKNISMTDVVKILKANGFEIVRNTSEISSDNDTEESFVEANKPEFRIKKLKEYLNRLAAGEDPEIVRSDFCKNFYDVDAAEIMQAEQELIEGGTPLAEVQRLCDIHSALFHGATSEEKIAAAEKSAKEITKRDLFPKKDYSNKDYRAAALEKVTGHPLYTLTKENEAFAELLSEFRAGRNETLLRKIREISIHYAKKGDLIYPQLKVKYGISGPSDVMWTVDDEIRDELSMLEKEAEHNEAWNLRLDVVLKRAEEMIYKEQNILFPICAVNFTEEEWFDIYRDSKDYDVCFGIANKQWEDAESEVKKKHNLIDDEIVMPGGHVTLEQLIALLNTIPMEITFVDADNINRFFNEGSKVFKRPGMAIDRNVFSCHPPKIEQMVKSIIDDFRNGRRDIVPVWMVKNGRSMLVKYMAVRDGKKNYLGTVELVQDMEFAKEHFLG